MGQLTEVKVPDIGDFDNVPVIEVLVKPGDTVTKDQGLITLESDKATMEVPSSMAGVVKEVKVKVGDDVSEGTVVVTLEAAEGGGEKPAPKPEAPKQSSPLPPAGEADAQRASGEGGGGKKTAPESAPPSPQPSPASGRGGESLSAGAPNSPPIEFGAATVMPDKVPYASPSIRLFARELGVDLTKVKGSARNGRISKEDVQNFVKQALAGGGAVAAGGGTGLNLLPWPKVDFSKFGEVETKPLSKIKKISGANLARNWVMIPHVTQHDDADVTDLEALRVQLNKEHEKAGVKFTMLGFIIKAVVAGLKKYPDFNASLDAAGENLILKKYFNVGFAADTPNGLVVPVLQGCRQKRSRRNRAGNQRAGEQGARRQTRSGGNVGRLLLDFLARRHRRHGVHADRQRAGSGDPRRVEVGDETGVGRQGVPAASDPAAVAVVRSSRHRRRFGGALHRVPRAGARRHAAQSVVSGMSVRGHHGRRPRSEKDDVVARAFLDAHAVSEIESRAGSGVDPSLQQRTRIAHRADAAWHVDRRRLHHLRLPAAERRTLSPARFPAVDRLRQRTLA